MGGEDDRSPAVTLPPKPPTSFPSIRFLGLVKQPESEPAALELDERDVVWPSDLKPDPFHPDGSESEPDHEPDTRGRLYPAPGFGLSAVFAGGGGVAIRRPARPPTGPVPDAMAKSAPVNVPTWHVRRTAPPARLDDVEEEEDDVEEMVPPHVMVARSHVTSFSVFEGVGRTLKGRDLRRVRNAVFRQTGFLD